MPVIWGSDDSTEATNVVTENERVTILVPRDGSNNPISNGILPNFGGTATHVHVRVSVTNSVLLRVTVWENTLGGTNDYVLVGSGYFDGANDLTTGQWSSVALDSPIQLDDDKYYTVGFHANGMCWMWVGGELDHPFGRRDYDATFDNVPAVLDVADADHVFGSFFSPAVYLEGSAGSSGPTIDTQPTSQTVTAPASATFTVAASGEGTLSYQWQVNDGGGWENISGATSSSYNTGSTTTALDGYQYRVNVTDDNDTVTSNAVTLTVEAAPGPQLTAPTFINLGQTTVTPRVTTDTDNGDIYYVIFLRSQSDPTATQIRNGQNSAGVAAIRSGNTPVTEAGVVTFPEVTGLDDDTEYRMGFVHEGIGPGE